MVLNDAGRMIDVVWNEIPKFYTGFKTDFFQIMPNHFHGIISIVGADIIVCPEIKGHSQGNAPTLTLSDVIGRFKSITTKYYIDGVKQNDWQSFDGKLWQRNFYACPDAERGTYYPQ